MKNPELERAFFEIKAILHSLIDAQRRALSTNSSAHDDMCEYLKDHARRIQALELWA